MCIYLILLLFTIIVTLSSLADLHLDVELHSRRACDILRTLISISKSTKHVLVQCWN